MDYRCTPSCWTVDVYHHAGQNTTIITVVVAITIFIVVILFKSVWTDTFPLCTDISFTSALTTGYMWNNTNKASTGPSGASQDRQGQNVWATSSVRGCRAAASHENVHETPLALPHQFTSILNSLFFFVVSPAVLGVRLDHQATVTTSLPSGSLCSSQGSLINQRLHQIMLTRAKHQRHLGF